MPRCAAMRPLQPLQGIDPPNEAILPDIRCAKTLGRSGKTI